MCGFTGICALTDKGLPYLARLQPALEAIAHRGPDHQGIFTQNRIALGHVRLSIIDLSTEAHQPFTDSSGRYAIIYNGEIFNFQHLRQEMVSQGYSFHTQSDTEVLLQLWIREGIAGIDKVNGFFAFVVFDKENETVHLVRDRYGVKPLYYYLSEDVLVFGSEVGALMAAGIPRQLNRESLFIYFQLNYLPPTLSILEGVKQLSPGWYACLSDGELALQPYYTIPVVPKAEYPEISYDDAVKEVHRLVDRSVQRRLISDVPLGSFLSGGLDSSIIASRAVKHLGKLKTFAIGFKEHSYYDESGVAERVARHLGTEHTTIMACADDLLGCLPEMLDHLSEPFADSSALAVYLLSKEVKKHVTVALSGDGADELFGGYLKHSAEYRARNLGMPGKLAIRLAPYLKGLPQTRSGYAGNKLRQLQRFAESVRLPLRDRYWRWCSIQSEEQVWELQKAKPDFESFMRIRHQYLENISYSGDFNEVLLSDMNLVLAGDMLVKADRMSMAHALELRSPFLDRELIDYGFQLPAPFKTGLRQRKKILRDAFRKELPAEVIERPKHGFEVPMLGWMRRELKSMIFDDLLNEEFIMAQGIFNPEVIGLMKKQLMSANPGDIQARMWAMIVFQHWYKKYSPHV